MSVPKIKLGGSQIPQVGLGFWQVRDEKQFMQAFKAAADAGYRHFDSAQIYANEAMLGNAWKKSGIKRDEMFLTTKIWIKNFTHARLEKSFEESLKNLQTDHVDLLLLHFPVTFLRKSAWKTLEDIKDSGGATNIGVSNYTVRHLKSLLKYARIKPAVNQVELHVFLQQPKLLDYCSRNGIKVEAYSPLAHSKDMTDPVVAQIAEKHGKTYAQIMLHWCIEKGLIILPKSVTPSRIVENIDIFDFSLDAEDMWALETCNKNLRTCWSPVNIP